LHWFGNGAPTAGVLLSERVGLDRSVRFISGRVRPKSGLESAQPSLAALPLEWSVAFQRIGAQLLAMVPREHLPKVAGSASDMRRVIGQLPSFPGSREM